MSPPRTASEFGLFACDTNCLVATAPRRVLMSLADTIGQRTLVLPQVHVETVRNIAKLTKHYVRRRLNARATDTELVHQAESTAGIGATRWWKDECTRNDSPIMCIDPTSALADEYDVEFVRLPEDAFAEGTNSDRAIIAQAIVHRIPVVVSHNFNSIDREMIERASDRGICGHTEILTMRETFDVTASRLDVDPAEHLIETIARVAVSEERRPHGLDMQSIRNLVENLSRFEGGSRLPRGRTLFALAADRMEKMHDSEARRLIEHAWETRPERVRAAETRRLQAQASALASVRGLER